MGETTLFLWVGIGMNKFEEEKYSAFIPMQKNRDYIK